MQSKLRAARMSRGWSQADLAKWASAHASPDGTVIIDTNTIWRLENRPITHVPPAPVFRPICEALDLDVYDLLTAAGYFDLPGDRYP